MANNFCLFRSIKINKKRADNEKFKVSELAVWLDDKMQLINFEKSQGYSVRT